MPTHIQHCWTATLLNGVSRKAIKLKHMKHMLGRKEKLFLEVFVEFLMLFVFFNGSFMIKWRTLNIHYLFLTKYRINCKKCNLLSWESSATCCRIHCFKKTKYVLPLLSSKFQQNLIVQSFCPSISKSYTFCAKLFFLNFY